MVYDIALNAKTHDIVVDSGNLLLIDNRERIAQQAKIRLWRWRGEWFLDSRDGLPYRESILVKTPNLKHIRQLIISELKGVEGVTNATAKLSYDPQYRTLSVAFELTTDYGIIRELEILGYE